MLTAEQIHAISMIDELPVDEILPVVSVDYIGGKIENGVANSAIKVGAYKLDSQKNSTKFVTTTPAYTTGMAGDTNGAIKTNHLNGAYTVVEKYP